MSDVKDCPRCKAMMRGNVCPECGFTGKKRDESVANRPRLPYVNNTFDGPGVLLEYMAMAEKARVEFHAKLQHPRRRRHIQKYPRHRRWAIRVLWRYKLGDWRIPSLSLETARAALKMPGGNEGHEHDWSKLKKILSNRLRSFDEKRKQRESQAE